MVTTESYDEYKREYNVSLSRIRSYLAGSTRNRTIMIECDRRLSDAKRCATAMAAMAEIEGNAMRMAEAQSLLERDIGPLGKEIQRQLGATSTVQQQQQHHHQHRQELFYQAPDIESGNRGDHNDGMLDSLIQSSDDLLRDSQAILAETEEIGTRTLHQMGRQREQIENSNQHLTALQAATHKAKSILSSMVYRAWRSKMALYVMIVVLTGANLYALYYILILKHQKKHDPQQQPNNNNDPPNNEEPPKFL
ncbi:hypothetical protein ACA910_015969 [Epithemia clementina (nom. ined.)]